MLLVTMLLATVGGCVNPAEEPLAEEEGVINGVPTTVTIELLTINSSVYKAWAHPVGHCHAHAWWSD